MLVLSRKSEQTIRINGDITITVLAIKGNKVSLGINAPEEVRVLREELAEFLECPRAKCGERRG